MILKKSYSIFTFFLIIGICSITFSLLTDLSPCVFYNFSGIPCPSCGMTRAYIAFLSGNFLLAIWDHPLFWTVPLIPLLLIGQSSASYKSFKKKLLPTLVILFIFVWIIRLILFFPHTSPMEFNKEALLPKLLNSLF